MKGTALSMAVPIDGENHQFTMQIPLWAERSGRSSNGISIWTETEQKGVKGERCAIY